MHGHTNIKLQVVLGDGAWWLPTAGLANLTHRKATYFVKYHMNAHVFIHISKGGQSDFNRTPLAADKNLLCKYGWITGSRTH